MLELCFLFEMRTTANGSSVRGHGGIRRRRLLAHFMLTLLCVVLFVNLSAGADGNAYARVKRPPRTPRTKGHHSWSQVSRTSAPSKLSFEKEFETLLQDTFLSIQVGDERSSRRKADSLLRCFSRYNSSSDLDFDPQWVVPLKLGPQGPNSKPLEIVLSVGCVLLDAYISFPKLDQFRQVLMGLFARGLDPNTMTPWMDRSTPLLGRAIIHHRYDIALFQSLASAGGSFETIHTKPPTQRSERDDTQFGLSLLHLFLFPQETTDSTLKFLFEANRRISPDRQVKDSTDKLRFPGDVVHEFDGLEFASETFMSLVNRGATMMEMALNTSSLISEEVALTHLTQWQETHGGSGRNILCDLSLQLPGTGWNPLHICAFKGWSRLLRYIRHNVAEKSSSSTANVSTECGARGSTVQSELDRALRQVGIYFTCCARV